MKRGSILSFRSCGICKGHMLAVFLVQNGKVTCNVKYCIHDCLLQFCPTTRKRLAKGKLAQVYGVLCKKVNDVVHTFPTNDLP